MYIYIDIIKTIYIYINIICIYIYIISIPIIFRCTTNPSQPPELSRVGWPSWKLDSKTHELVKYCRLNTYSYHFISINQVAKLGHHLAAYRNPTIELPHVPSRHIFRGPDWSSLALFWGDRWCGAAVRQQIVVRRGTSCQAQRQIGLAWLSHA